MESQKENTVPTLSEKLKECKISITDIAAKSDVPRKRVSDYINDPSQENDVRVENSILDAIEMLVLEFQKAKDIAGKRIGSLLNSEVHPIAD